MEKKIIPDSELIINSDGTIFHLHLTSTLKISMYQVVNFTPLVAPIRVKNFYVFLMVSAPTISTSL